MLFGQRTQARLATLAVALASIGLTSRSVSPANHHRGEQNHVWEFPVGHILDRLARGAGCHRSFDWNGIDAIVGH
jgi:hypothetical protein